MIKTGELIEIEAPIKQINFGCLKNNYHNYLQTMYISKNQNENSLKLKTTSIEKIVDKDNYKSKKYRDPN